MNSVRIKFGFTGGLHVDRVGYGGGLSLLWMDSIDVTILSYSHGHIDAIVKDHLGLQWRFTGFYGHPKREQRHHSWNLLRRLGAVSSLPWMCAGDFNEIMYQGEKDGSRPATLAQMESFKQAVEDCDLHDLGCSNGTFTWSGMRYSTYVRERLDRALATTTWQNMFPQSKVSLYATSKSDHLPLVISLNCLPPFTGTSHGFIRRYETFWTQDDECREVINYAWQPRSSSNPRHLMAAIDTTRQSLKLWSKNKYGFLPQKINSIRGELQSMLQSPAPSATGISQLKCKLQELEAQEESYWRQRSRVEWLQFGDRNTQYFHHKANSRKKSNAITSIHDDQGVLYSTADDISLAFQNFYNNLFTASPIDLSIVNGMEFTTLSPSSKHLLENPYTLEEVQKALKDLPATKSPGSDGLHVLFLKKYWDILGGDVSFSVLEFLNHGGDLSSINHTLICLVPKLKNAAKITDYRPISLCTSIYKLISRVLVNRLKLVIGEVIDCSQTAFVPGRLLMDNGAIACEAFHVLKSQTSSQRKYIALKIDMAKAFDKVQWMYLHKIMTRMEFPQQFISRIMSCVTSTSLSLIINGRTTPAFTPTCGLRQGDPLSPFLFIMCAEGFSSLIRKEVNTGAWAGLQFGHYGPQLSHLFFADDCLLFAEATQSSLDAITRALNSYAAISGQRINYHKSTVYSSRNVPSSEMINICSSLSMEPGATGSLHLGLPFLIGRSKKQVFQFVIDRVRKKLNGWKEKFLTSAGKEVLIKSIVQAIPNHIMQCFLLPDNVCNDIMALTRQFWWGKGCEDKAVCWKSWKDMCKPKGSGGMGFKDLKITNLALLAKQGWRIIKQPDSLLARIFKARYFPQQHFMHSALGSRPSYVWRSILAGRELLEQGIRFQVGNGQNIHIWNDRWLPKPYQFQLNPVNRYKWPEATVADLILPHSNDWNIPLLQYLFQPHEVDEVLKIPLNVSDLTDHLVWHHSSNGSYSVKSGYKAYQMSQNSFLGCSSLGSSSPQKSIWNKLWTWPIQPKIRHFLWRAMHNTLSVGANLSMKGIQGVYCPHCQCTYETDRHLFFECPYARKVWSQLQIYIPGVLRGSESFYALVSRLVEQETEQLVTLFFATTWNLWKARCSLKFENKFMSTAQLLSLVNSSAQECMAKDTHHNSDHELRRWPKPQTGRASIHVDAGVRDDGTTSYGVIIRDSECRILVAKAGPMQQHISIEHAELNALLQGLLLARELNFQNIQIYSDSKLAISRLDSKEKDCSLVSPLVQRFRKLSNEFENVLYGFVRREGNAPAHLLASIGLTLCNPINWGSSPPNDVIFAVMFDSECFNE